MRNAIAKSLENSGNISSERFIYEIIWMDWRNFKFRAKRSNGPSLVGVVFKSRVACKKECVSARKLLEKLTSEIFLYDESIYTTQSVWINQFSLKHFDLLRWKSISSVVEPFQWKDFGVEWSNLDWQEKMLLKLYCYVVLKKFLKVFAFLSMCETFELKWAKCASFPIIWHR